MRQFKALGTTAFRAAIILQESGAFAVLAMLGFILALAWYAILINNAAGLEYRLGRLSRNISQIEGELAKNQAALTLREVPRAPEAMETAGLTAIGSDLSYLHASAVFVDASLVRY